MSQSGLLYRMTAPGAALTHKLMLHGVIIDTNVHIKPMWESPCAAELHVEKKEKPKTVQEQAIERQSTERALTPPPPLPSLPGGGSQFKRPEIADERLGVK